MSKKPIFIHIPKTGGTTINTVINNSYWQTPVDFNYRHILKETFASNCGDIFEPQNREKYSEYVIFMMLREPFDRLVSEYYFLNTRAEFTSLLKKKPSSFMDYAENPQTQNYVVKFLLGRKIYDPKPITESEFEQVIQAIEKVPVHVGIYECFQESMGYFSDVTKLEWPKKAEAKRIGFKREKKENFNKETIEKVLALNPYDQKLYEYCLARFNALKEKYKNYKIDFISSKYNHIIAFSRLTNIFEMCVSNKNYLKQNYTFFKDFTFHLIKDLNITDGKQYCQIWNQTFIEHIRFHFPESPFLNAIESAYKSSPEPLDQTIAIGEALDAFFEKEGKKADKYFKTMAYDKAKMVFVDVKKSHTESKGFWTKLFGK